MLVKSAHYASQYWVNDLNDPTGSCDVLLVAQHVSFRMSLRGGCDLNIIRLHVRVGYCAGLSIVVCVCTHALPAGYIVHV